MDATDPVSSSPLYFGGVLVIGSTKGKLYFLDRNTGTVPGVSIIREFMRQIGVPIGDHP